MITSPYMETDAHAVYPRQAKRLVTDPSKNIFVPLVVSFLSLVLGAIGVIANEY